MKKGYRFHTSLGYGVIPVILDKTTVVKIMKTVAQTPSPNISIVAIDYLRVLEIGTTAVVFVTVVDISICAGYLEGQLPMDRFRRKN